MKSVVIYFSKFGNTKKVAEVIAKELKSAGPLTLRSYDEIKISELKEADLVVMGTPTYNMNLPKSVKPLFDKLPKKILRSKNVASFDTSYKMPKFLSPFTAAKKLNSKLGRLGGKKIVPPETFLVTGKEGPLFEGELEHAKKWAKTILDKFDKDNSK